MNVLVTGNSHSSGGNPGEGLAFVTRTSWSGCVLQAEQFERPAASSLTFHRIFGFLPKLSADLFLPFPDGEGTAGLREEVGRVICTVRAARAWSGLFAQVTLRAGS